MVEILLLEDEIYTRRFFKKLLLENPQVTKVYDTSSGSQAQMIAKQHRPHIAMLDIELGADEPANGLEIAKSISHELPEVYFIFVTGYAQYAIDAFAVHPFDYILKPVKKGKIFETINKIADKIKKDKKPLKIILEYKGQTAIIDSTEILFIEKSEKNIIVHTQERAYTTKDSISGWRQRLDGNFIKVHQSFIVNKAKISNITKLENRSFEIEFLGYQKKARMSRYQYEDIKRG